MDWSSGSACDAPCSNGPVIRLWCHVVRHPWHSRERRWPAAPDAGHRRREPRAHASCIGDVLGRRHRQCVRCLWLHHQAGVHTSPYSSVHPSGRAEHASGTGGAFGRTYRLTRTTPMAIASCIPGESLGLSSRAREGTAVRNRAMCNHGSNAFWFVSIPHLSGCHRAIYAIDFSFSNRTHPGEPPLAPRSQGRISDCTSSRRPRSSSFREASPPGRV